MIDIHSHFFNLKYLPVAGIIRRYTNKAVPHIIAIGVERLLIRDTKSSIPIEGDQDFFTLLEEEESVLTRVNKVLSEKEEKHILELTQVEIENRILNRVTESDFKDDLVRKALTEFERIESIENKSLQTLDSTSLYSEGTILYFAEKGIPLIRRLLNWIAEKIDQAFNTIEKGINFLRWFGFMQRSEHEMLEYIRTKDEPNVKLFVHQLMDVDFYFNDKEKPNRYLSTFSYNIQIAKMEFLNKEFPDTLIGLVAFDPSKDDCLDIVKKAIEQQGFKGIKFYPPLGYRADDDPRYKDKIDKLFQYCISRDVPLFTHCNKQGFEAFPKEHSGHNSNPLYWEKALDKYPSLRLCLAHAGGVEGWFAKIENDEQIHETDILPLQSGKDEEQYDWNSSYAKIVYKLCLKFPNVYCDAAYLDEVSEEYEYIYFRDRLEKLFRAEPSFSKKLIYGSDWHMLFQEAKNNRYLDDYIRLFNEPCFTDDNRNDFFKNNAKRYLKITS